MEFNLFKIQKEIDRATQRLEELSIVDPLNEKQLIQLKRERLENNKSFIIQVSTLLFVAVTPFIAVVIFYFQNDLANRDFVTRMRPYISIEKIDKFEDGAPGKYRFVLSIKNFGNTPALVTQQLLRCNDQELYPRNPSRALINSGQSLLPDFYVENISEFKCSYIVQYVPAIKFFKDVPNYETMISFHYFSPKPGLQTVTFDNGYMK